MSKNNVSCRHGGPYLFVELAVELLFVELLVELLFVELLVELLFVELLVELLFVELLVEMLFVELLVELLFVELLFVLLLLSEDDDVVGFELIAVEELEELDVFDVVMGLVEIEELACASANPQDH